MPLPKKTTWVAVADGGKALLLENTGTDAKPALEVLTKRELENPPNREQGTDRPGRFADRGPGQRSAAEVPDWHEFAEAAFAREFAGLLGRAAREGRYDRLVLIAPDRVIGALRPALAPEASERVILEMRKDLTNHPVPEIESLLGRTLFPA